MAHAIGPQQELGGGVETAGADLVAKENESERLLVWTLSVVTKEIRLSFRLSLFST